MDYQKLIDLKNLMLGINLYYPKISVKMKSLVNQPKLITLNLLIIYFYQFKQNRMVYRKKYLKI